MDTPGIDLSPLRKALGVLAEALQLWHSQDAGSVLKPHLRSAVIQSFEFSYELSLRSLRRVLVERAGSADRITDLSFNELLRHAADAGLDCFDEQVHTLVLAHDAERFCVDARSLLAALEAAL